MGQSIWKLKTGSSDSWPSWKRHNIVSIGWDVGNPRNIQNKLGSQSEVKHEIKSRLEDKYPSWKKRKIDATAGTIRSFTSVREDRTYDPGDIVVILRKGQVRGESILYGVGELEYFEYKKWDVQEDEHPYQWKANYLATGPVRVSDLSEEFSNIQFRGTEQRYRAADRELIERLISDIEDAVDSRGRVDFRERYFDYDSLSESHLQRFIDDNPGNLDERLSEVDREVQLRPGERADFIGTTQLGDEIVIETKLETARTAHVDQLLRYIASKEEEAETTVQGMLVAEDFRDDTIEYARQHDIQLVQFRVSPTFQRLMWESRSTLYMGKF